RAGDSPMVRRRRENGRDEPWRVPLWGIGNEGWGCGGNMRAEAYAGLALQCATFCRDHGDHKLYRIAAGRANGDLEWTKALMEAISCLHCAPRPRQLFQAISFHYYTRAGAWENKGSATRFDLDQYYLTLGSAQHVERLIKSHSAMMDVYDP